MGQAFPLVKGAGHPVATGDREAALSTRAEMLYPLRISNELEQLVVRRVLVGLEDPVAPVDKALALAARPQLLAKIGIDLDGPLTRQRPSPIRDPAPAKLIAHRIEIPARVRIASRVRISLAPDS